jgi:5-formyltetrahydrofolate cyclo-ligase
MKEKKKLLRKEILQKAEKIEPEETEASNKKIFRQLLNLEEYKKAKTIFTYISINKEPDTTEIIKSALADKKTICAPTIHPNLSSSGLTRGSLTQHKASAEPPNLRQMKPKKINSLEDLTEGDYNIPEPNQTCKEVPKSEIDLAIIPCVTADKEGYRLGYGGGFYDKYLADADFVKVLIIRKKQMIENVPREPHDVKVDIIVTEDRIIRI